MSDMLQLVDIFERNDLLASHDKTGAYRTFEPRLN